jgi:hypothetical protein
MGHLALFTRGDGTPEDLTHQRQDLSQRMQTPVPDDQLSDMT